jgi:hypothetical protein
LGDHLRVRHQQRGDTDDLHAAIDAYQHALALTPDTRERHTGRLIDLANALINLWFLLGRPKSQGFLGQAAEAARRIPEAERVDRLSSLHPALVAVLKRGEA